VSPVRLGRRPVLDGLRGFAVLAVVGLHLGLIPGGYAGVDVFFVLSGFLITALLYEEWESGGEIRLRAFYARRVRRLLPALLLLVAGFTAVMLVLQPFGGLWPLGRLIATTLLDVNNWVTALVPRHGRVLGALVPTWTLAEEVQFYLLWPFALALLLRRRTRTVVTLGLLSLGMFSLLGAAELMRDIYPYYNAYTSPFDRAAELLLGSAAAIVWRERLLPAALRSRAAAWIAAGGLVFVMLDAAVPARWWYMSSALLAAVLIVNLIDGGRQATDPRPRTRREASVLARLIGSRPLQHTGKISYGIYLYHLPIYYLLWTAAPGRSRYLYAPIVMATSFAMATMSWRLIEAPVLRHRSRKRRPGHAPDGRPATGSGTVPANRRVDAVPRQRRRRERALWVRSRVGLSRAERRRG